MKQPISIKVVRLVLLIACLLPLWNIFAQAAPKPETSGVVFAEKIKVNTIQVLSSPNEKEVIQAARILDRMIDGVFVEKIADLYILRIGSFPDSQEGIREGLSLLDEVRKIHPKAFLRPISKTLPSAAFANIKKNARLAEREQKKYLNPPPVISKPDHYENLYYARPDASRNTVKSDVEKRGPQDRRTSLLEMNDILEHYPPGAGLGKEEKVRTAVSNPSLSKPPATMPSTGPVPDIHKENIENQKKVFKKNLPATQTGADENSAIKADQPDMLSKIPILFAKYFPAKASEAYDNKAVNNSGSDMAGPLTLQDSIKIALKQSMAVKSAREGIIGAEYAKNEALTNFLPRLSTSYSYTRLNEPPIFRTPDTSISLTTNNGSSSSTSTIRIPSLDINMGTRDNYAWALEVKQPLFAGGGILANYMASLTGEEITRMEETAAMQDVIQEVKVSYYSVLKARSLQDVAVKSLNRLQAHRDMAKSHYEVGIIARNDYLAVEVELANGEQNLVKALNGVELAQAKFNTTLRRPLTAPVELVDTLEFRPIDRTLDLCISEAMNNRPEIKTFSLKAKQAGYLVNAAKSEYYPTVNFVGRYELSGNTPGVNGATYPAVSESGSFLGNRGKVTIDGSLTRDRESWYLMAVASWNFWEWGKTRNRVGNARSREMQVNYALTNIRDQISLEVTKAWLTLNEAEKQISVARKAIDEARENLMISIERYQDRMATTTVVLDAQTRFTKANSDYYNALGDYHISLAKLERAMGVSN